MRYIYIDPELDVRQLKDFLKREMDQTDQDTIIRFRSLRPIGNELALLMTRTNLRNILPAGMNFSYSSNFFNPHF